jgi:crotonobetainyl-CoA:carnitine CoA-transferase CaiB-like acyl-CoA transferase
LIARQWEPMPQQRLIADLAAVFATKSAEAWEATLGSVECCFGIVIEPREVPSHPQIAARGMVAVRDNATVEALFPAWVDGQAPHRRTAPVIAEAAGVLARWRAAS